MNNREAQEIIRMIESNWHMDLDSARKIWRDALVKYDADLVSRVVADVATRGSKSHYLQLDELLDAVHAATGREVGLPPTRGTNQSAPTSKDVCPACSGDRFVVYSVRSEHKIEEMAPCPLCNAVEISMRRVDGTVIRTPDPGRVREMLRL